MTLVEKRFTDEPSASFDLSHINLYTPEDRRTTSKANNSTEYPNPALLRIAQARTMSAMPSSARAGEVPCPDPSAHGQSHKLSEQASTAALYVTDPARHAESRQAEGKKSALGPDGKLSSSSK